MLSRIQGIIRRRKDRERVAQRHAVGGFNEVNTAAYYEHHHNTSQKYQDNNWLVDDIGILRNITDGVVCEIGCGNSKFLHQGAPYFRKMLGVDWAVTPGALNLPPNVDFMQADLSQGFPPASMMIDPNIKLFDLLCSADFFEHLHQAAAEHLIQEMLPTAKYHYHKIACYDDYRHHLTILSPSEWLALFKKHDKTFYLHRVDHRTKGRDVAIVTNYPSLPKA